MAKRFTHSVEVNGQTVGYSANPRPERGKWEVRFNGPQGERKRILTEHDIRGQHPPAEFHHTARKLVTDVYCPLTLFSPPAAHKTWKDCLAEVEATSPHTRPETFRSFRAAIKAWEEIMPDTTSPLDVSEDKCRRFAKLWLAAPNKQHKDKPRSPVTLSYYLRALSAFTNHLIQLGYLSRNVWHGIKAPKAEKTKKGRKHVPTETEVSKFFGYVHERYPAWVSLHALLELKAISACRTADVCQLKTEQLRASEGKDGTGELTFTADITKTKEDRSLPIPASLFKTLQSVAGQTWLWEKMFEEIKLYRKASNGYPPSFWWKTIYAVVNNLFREYNEGPNAGNPKFTPHALRRRAITLTVQATGNVDAAASAIGVHPQTARTYYLDARKAFDTAETMKRVAEALRPKVSAGDKE